MTENQYKTNKVTLKIPLEKKIKMIVYIYINFEPIFTKQLGNNI